MAKGPRQMDTKRVVTLTLTRADERFIKSLGAPGQRIWADLAHWVVAHWVVAHWVVAHRIEKSDRAVAILGASMLEAALESTLAAALADNTGAKNLFGRQGTLETLAAKADLAFAMGVLSEWEWRDLDRIRKIRNHFAHELRAGSFEEQPMNQLSNALFMAEYRRSRGGREPDPRAAFVTTCGPLAALLSSRVFQRPKASPFEMLRTHVLAPKQRKRRGRNAAARSRRRGVTQYVKTT